MDFPGLWAQKVSFFLVFFSFFFLFSFFFFFLCFFSLKKPSFSILAPTATTNNNSISVLDGGLPAWQSAGLPLEEGAVSEENAKSVDAPAEAAASFATETGSPSSSPPPRYPASLQRHLLRDLSQIRELSASGSSASEALVDARSRARFQGTGPEPRPGLPSGSIPGSTNCPYDSVLDPETKKLKEPKEVRSILGRAGFEGEDDEEGKEGKEKKKEKKRGAVATCGTGVTASVLAWACAASGLRDDVAVYDGSWSEWASLEDTPKATAAKEGGGS